MLICTDKAKADISRHIGAVGEKVSLVATIEFIDAWAGAYGTTFLHILTDQAGNVIVYRGSKFLGRTGAVIEMTAKVKAHGVRDGVQQAIIERPKMRAAR